MAWRLNIFPMRFGCEKVNQPDLRTRSLPQERSPSANPASPTSVFIYSSLLPAPLAKVWTLYADVNTINKISPFFARVNFSRVDLPLRAGSEMVFVGKYPPRLCWHARIETFVGLFFVSSSTDKANCWLIRTRKPRLLYFVAFAIFLWILRS